MPEGDEEVPILLSGEESGVEENEEESQESHVNRVSSPPSSPRASPISSPSHTRSSEGKGAVVEQDELTLEEGEQDELTLEKGEQEDQETPIQEDQEPQMQEDQERMQEELPTAAPALAVGVAPTVLTTEVDASPEEEEDDREDLARRLQRLRSVSPAPTPSSPALSLQSADLLATEDVTMGEGEQEQEEQLISTHLNPQRRQPHWMQRQLDVAWARARGRVTGAEGEASPTQEEPGDNQEDAEVFSPPPHVFQLVSDASPAHTIASTPVLSPSSCPSPALTPNVREGEVENPVFPGCSHWDAEQVQEVGRLQREQEQRDGLNLIVENTPAPARPGGGEEQDQVDQEDQEQLPTPDLSPASKLRRLPSFQQRQLDVAMARLRETERAREGCVSAPSLPAPAPVAAASARAASQQTRTPGGGGGRGRRGRGRGQGQGGGRGRGGVQGRGQRLVEAESQAEEATQLPWDLPSLEEAHHTHVPTHVFPPKAARGEFTKALTSLWVRAAGSPEDTRAWTAIYIFTRAILTAGRGPRLGDAYTHTREVKERLRRWGQGEYRQLWDEAVALTKPPPRARVRRRTGEAVRVEKTQEERNVERSTKLAHNGQYSRALTSLNSPGMAEHTRATKEEMRAKLPQPDLPTSFQPSADTTPITFSQIEVFTRVCQEK